MVSCRLDEGRLSRVLEKVKLAQRLHFTMMLHGVGCHGGEGTGSPEVRKTRPTEAEDGVGKR